jgi:hypothetical protein
MTPMTAETITDEDIKRWRRALRGHPRQTRSICLMIRDCATAVTDRRAMAFLMPGVREGVDRARARVADAINRAKGAK